jgi:hypothetical protein
MHCTKYGNVIDDSLPDKNFLASLLSAGESAWVHYERSRNNEL